MIKAVIFDLDGTLLNTSVEINLLINKALSKFNLRQISLKQTIEYIGNGAKKLVERAVPEEYSHLTEKVFEYFSKIYAECDNSNTTLYDGEEEVLYYLKQNGVKLAIVTNKPQAAANAVYKKLLSKFNFDLVIGQSEKFPVKPNPQSTLSAINSLGVEKEECLFVGDGETDVQTAINSKVNCVAVLWGYRNREQLKEVGAVNFAKSYCELKDFIKKF